MFLKSKITFSFLLCLVFLSSISLSAQSISGYIQNENNEPIPYVNIFVKELGSGTTTDEKGYYYLTLDVGEYELIYSVLGYTTKTLEVIIEDEPFRKDLWMESSGLELEQILVQASRRDSAYAIIQKAIDAKGDFLKQVESYRTNVYIKATEEIDKKKKRKRKKKEESNDSKTNQELISAAPIDPFADAEKKKLQAIDGLSMIETELVLNFKYPKKYKEERIAHKVYGDEAGLFIPRFGESEFNFYRNLVSIRAVSEVPIISPLSKTAILSYKYKLIGSTFENDNLVYKIKVIPRKKGHATCSGYIYINEGRWNINRLDFSLAKGALKFFDAFRIKQDFQQLPDHTWLPYRIEFIYQTKQGKRKTFSGNTLIHYTDYENNFSFPPKFFGNEISVTTSEAYKRDTTYWNSARPEPLTIKQQKLVAYKDSVTAVLSSTVYKDSIQALYNKVTFLDIVWDGVGFRDHTKKRAIYIGSLPGLLDFEIVGGFRLGPYASFFKRWEDGKWISTFGHFNIGIKNRDPQGDLSFYFRYHPHRLGDVYVSGGRSFEPINSFDAYINQLRTSNYFLHDYIAFGQQIELFNGLFLKTDISINDRQSVEDYISDTFISEIIEDEAAIAFAPYEALISSISLRYTPGQKFMTEPNRKIVLGSKWPTFSLRHEKGWHQVLSSDIDYDFVDFTVEQDLILGILGNSKYSIQTGKFLNTKKLRFVDLKRFRESDPWLYSDPLHSFQLLDTSLTGSKLFVELHHIHHFNGALINNIPLIRKTRVQVVAGAGFLWVNENQFRHEEVFAGLERVFKIGPRRRLRLGVYGVLANSNISGPKTGYKFSLDIIDTWKRNWSF